MTRTLQNTLVLFSTLAIMQGCMKKTITLQTDPADAAITITRLQGDAPAGQVPLDDPTSTREVELKFGDNVSYKVDARKPQYFPASTTIAYEPQDKTNYSLHLTQYEKTVTGVNFAPVRGKQVWQMAAVPFSSEAYVLDTAEPAGSVIRQPIQVTKTVTDAEVDYPFIALSPTTDVMVYQRVERQGNGYVSQLWKRSTTGGAAVRLTSSPAQEYTPAFTYGGDYVVFSSDNASENATLCKVKVDGGGTLISSLTQSSALDYAPSAGQTMLAYTSLPPRALEPQVWVARVDGTQAGFLSTGMAPQISPDEKRILFLRKGRQGFYQLWVMDPNGGNLTQLTQNTTYDILDPRWSPDGQWIAYSSMETKDRDGKGESDIWVIAANGSKKIQLTRNPSFDGSPAWDRNGKTIYFRSNRGGYWNIWKFDVQPKVLDAGMGQ